MSAFRKELHAIAGDEQRLANLLVDISDMDAAVEDRASELVQKARTRIKLDWEEFVRVICKVADGLEWTTTVVIKNSTAFWTTSVRLLVHLDSTL